jgi:TPR repeat protein
MPAPTEPSVKPRFPAAEIAALLARGDALLSTGDITSARLFYQRAADAGAGLAAVRLGETFDPAFLDRAHFRGARGDPGQAVSWYRRARDLGVTDAEVLLKTLQNN